jgi:hypothetical protein
MFDIRRRELITLLSGAAAAWPPPGACAAAGARAIVGMLSVIDLERFPPPIETGVHDHWNPHLPREEGRHGQSR